MKSLTIGVIGCGSISLMRHGPEYLANPAVNLKGCFDMSPDRAENFQSKFGGIVYHSVDEMLSDPEIDAVSICTANVTHAPLTIQALEMGKHVLCEKPMAINYAECEAMADAAIRTGNTLMIAHNQRFAAAHVKAKQLLKSGAFGKVLTFRSTFGHRGPELWSQDKSVNTWFFKKDSAAMGVTADLGIHKLDLIMWLLDDEIASVSAMTDTLDKRDGSGELVGVDDNMVSLLKMKKGSLGTLTTSWTYYGDEDNSTILYCKEGILRIYDNPDFPIETVMKDRSRALYKVGAIQTNDDKVQVNSGVIDAFVDAVKNGTKPAVPLSDAMYAMKAIFACLESSQTQRPVYL